MARAVSLHHRRRFFDDDLSCYPVINATALATALADRFIGLVVGTIAEAGRMVVVGALRQRSDP